MNKVNTAVIIPCLTSVSGQKAISTCIVHREDPNDLYSRCVSILGHHKMTFNAEQAKALATALIQATSEKVT